MKRRRRIRINRDNCELQTLRSTKEMAMPREKAPTTTAPKKRAPRKTLKIPKSATPVAPSFVDPRKRAALIAEAAYYRAEKRGFAPGHEAADWLAAETEVDALLLQGAGGNGV
jgi:DUF2934 family protein